MVSSTVDDADAVNLGNGSHGDGIYVRFDVPKPETKRTWISVKGEPSFLSQPPVAILCTDYKIKLSSINVTFLALKYSNMMFFYRASRSEVCCCSDDLALYALNPGDIFYHTVSVPWFGVRVTQRYTGRMAAYSHHGSVQHGRLCGQGEMKQFDVIYEHIISF